MISDLWLRNLAACGLQAGVLVLAGSLLARLFRIEQPRAALAYWRVLLLASLLLPFAQPWRVIPPEGLAVVARPTPVTNAGTSLSHQGGATSSPRLSLETLTAIVLCGGMLVRGVWLMIGAWVLGRIRREAVLLVPVPESITRAQDRVGVAADVYLSRRVSGPITFGLRHPVIVFPPGITSLNPSVQHAIACHELLHVRRRDWPFQLTEEGIRTVLWFHPAVWWLVGRIQLAREQLVDQESVTLIESRESYVEALLAVATAKSSGYLTPAPAFFRRSLLKKRVAHILQERTMTARRLFMSLGVSAAALGLAAVIAVRSFPLEAHGRAPSGATQPVEIVKGGEHLLHGEVPEYPERAIEQKVEGDVLLDIAVDDRGEVSDARVLSGPDELRKAALGAVLGWHYSPADLRSASTQATIRFTLAAANTTFHGQAYSADMKEEKGELSNAQRLERVMGELQRAMEDPNISASQLEEYRQKTAIVEKQLEHIRAETAGREIAFTIERRDGDNFTGPSRLVAFTTERVSADVASQVFKRSGLKIGEPITEQSLKALNLAAAGVDEHLHVVMHHEGEGRVSLVLVSRE
jgi:TonB family protein